MLRLAVNLARFTKTRVCLSCFGSTNVGHAAFHQDPDLFKFYKTWAPCKCFNSQTALMLYVGFVSLSSPRFIGSVLLDRWPCRLTLALFLGHPSFDAPRQ